MTSHHLKVFEKNTKGRDFAVGDIHGCFRALGITLKAMKFDETSDRLFAVGDLVDRGPESAEVLDWLAKPWFHAIQGNHDFLTWRHAQDDPYPHVDHLQHGGQWLLSVPSAKRRKIGRALEALPLAMEVETDDGSVGLVHADCPFDDWADMHGALTASQEHCCLWSFSRVEHQNSEPIRNIRAVVHGHFVVDQPSCLGNVYYIDTGSWPRNGFLTFLDLADMRARRGPDLHKIYADLIP